jgi:hypothetical protein
MPEKRASPRLNVRHVNPAVSVTRPIPNVQIR